MAWNVMSQRVPGELVTAAMWNEIPQNFQAIPERVTTSATGTQNDLDPAVSGPWIVLRAANASALTISGIVFQDDNEVIVVEATNSGVTLKNEDSGSTAANRIATGTGADVVLAAGERAWLIYDPTDSRWRLNAAQPGSGSGTQPLIFTLGSAELDPTNPPDFGNANGLMCLLFDDSTDEIVRWRFRMPAFTSLTLTGIFSMVSATSGNAAFETRIWAITPGDSADADTPSYATADSTGAVAVPGTAGHTKEFSVTISNDDGLQAGDLVVVEFRRDVGIASNATGDAEVRALSLDLE